MLDVTKIQIGSNVILQRDFMREGVNAKVVSIEKTIIKVRVIEDDYEVQTCDNNLYERSA